MNIKEQFHSREFMTPSIFNGNNIAYKQSDQWYINGVPVIGATGATGIIPDWGATGADRLPKANSSDTFQRNLEILNNKINILHKELTYWDLFKLAATVTNPNDIDAVFSGLAIGQALVINCPSFNKGDVFYSRGDVIVKISENEEIKIDALTNGLFYPCSINTGEGESTYILTYKYIESTDVDESTVENLNVGSTYIPDERLAGQINITLNAEKSDLGYGHWSALNAEGNYTFDASGDIRPVIKFYLGSDSGYEEILIDYSLALNGTEYSVSVSSDFPSDLYIQVK